MTRSGCSSRRRRRPTAGSDRAPRSGCRWSGRPPAWSSLPLAVYVLSYIPWAMVEGHQCRPGRLWATPPGHTGQTLLDLTGQMYRYHNGLPSRTRPRRRGGRGRST